MNKNLLKKYGLIILLITFILGCKDKGDSSSNSDSAEENNTSVEAKSDLETTSDLDVNTSSFSEGDKSLICLWSKVGLRDIAGRKGAKYLSTIYFGETVKFLGEKEKASDNKDYLKVELSDGQQGWVYDYLFAKNGKLSVLKNPLAMYKRPDVMEFTGNKFKRGNIVVVLDENKGEWQKIVGFEKKNEGWIQKGNNFVYDALDIKLAILYNRAMNESSHSKKQKKLKLIVDNPAFQKSSFIDIVEGVLDTNNEEDFSDIQETINSNQLYITTEVLNARSNPDPEGDNVIFQLEKGNICNIVEKGDYETIRGNSSNWYKVEFEGNEGWVFGYFTSKK